MTRPTGPIAETEAALQTELAGNIAAGRDDRAADVTEAFDQLGVVPLIAAMWPDPDRPDVEPGPPERPFDTLSEPERRTRRINEHKTALAAERDGYLARDWTERAAEVDAAIANADTYRTEVSSETAPDAPADVEPEPEVLPE